MVSGFDHRISRSQVDRLGDRLRNGELTVETLQNLELYRQQFSSAYQFVEQMLAEKMKKVVTGRPSKSTIAIVEKLRRGTSRLSQMQDIAGCRVVLDNLVEQENFCANAVVLLGKVAVVDRRKSPSHGYRAVHLVVDFDSCLVEVQVRTRAQHAWAEFSEKLADTYGQEIKYGSGNERVVEFLCSLSDCLYRIECVNRDKSDYGRRTLLTRAVRGLSARDAKRKIKDFSRLRAAHLRELQSILNAGKELM